MREDVDILAKVRLAGDFLPMTRQEMAERGWDQLDFILISGDAYVDHPSFGPAIIGRVLESAGYKVGIIAQPDWRSERDFVKLGRPRLAALVTAGNLDSMVSNYTASKKPRRQDDYSPGGIGGKRPDMATIVYANRIRQAYKGVPIILGGIEASLRRFAHYDYWTDAVRRSVLVDSRADLLLYGMAEKSILAVADHLAEGTLDWNLSKLRGICYLTEATPGKDTVVLPSYDAVAADKKAFAKAFRLFCAEQDPYQARAVAQLHQDHYVVQAPPTLPMSMDDMDRIYGLPFTRRAHPAYDLLGGVPALEEVEFSITSHRGCFGSCSFCALTAHQGRVIQRRSRQSLVDEARLLTNLPRFKGYIHDVGGPTANFHQPACQGQETRGACRNKQCMFPEPCRQLETSHDEYLAVLREMRSLPGIKKVFVRSGLRYDYLLCADDNRTLEELVKHHISGQLKVAPEHVSKRVTGLMQKPGREVFDRFQARYRKANERLGLKQFLVPYFMSSHPGSTLEDAIELAEYLRDTGLRPEQVQDFIPTPGSLSTAMFYTGLDPLTNKPVHVPRTAREKNMQRALLQYWLPKHYPLVLQALKEARREDLIGFGPKCLIRPPRATEQRQRAAEQPKKQARKPRNRGKASSRR